jgi:hypothetical protein
MDLLNIYTRNYKYSKCHVTSNRAKSNLECAEDKFQTRGWVRGYEKWKNECLETPPTTSYARDLTRNAGPCSKLRDTCYNYDSLTELHTPEITVTTTHKVFSLFSSRCFVTAFIGESSPSSELLSSLYSPGTNPAENVSTIVACYLVAGETCPQNCSLPTAVVLSPVYIAVT